MKPHSVVVDIFLVLFYSLATMENTENKVPQKLTPDQIESFAQTLHNARLQKKEIEPLSKVYGDYSLEDSYKVQKRGIALRLQDGEKIIGYKMGLTSKAKMEQMGLHTPIFGVLTDKMLIPRDSTFNLSERVHPKTEPEIYFITNQELSGSLDVKDVPSVCEKIGVALEILDSRYQGFKYFSLPDVIADNASASHFVLGDVAKDASQLDWPALKIDLLCEEAIQETALGSSILGNPLQSLCELVSLLHAEGLSLPKGSIVLAGAATTAIALKPGQVSSATLEKVGRVAFST